MWVRKFIRNLLTDLHGIVHLRRLRAIEPFWRWTFAPHFSIFILLLSSQRTAADLLIFFFNGYELVFHNSRRLHCDGALLLHFHSRLQCGACMTLWSGVTEIFFRRSLLPLLFFGRWRTAVYLNIENYRSYSFSKKFYQISKKKISRYLRSAETATAFYKILNIIY